MDTMALKRPKAPHLAKFATPFDGTPFYLDALYGDAPKGEKIERELTPEEEKTAFLCTAKLNAVKMLANYTE
jgi:hypothetical protein